MGPRRLSSVDWFAPSKKSDLIPIWNFSTLNARVFGVFILLVNKSKCFKTLELGIMSKHFNIMYI